MPAYLTGYLEQLSSRGRFALDHHYQHVVEFAAYPISGQVGPITGGGWVHLLPAVAAS